MHFATLLYPVEAEINEFCVIVSTHPNSYIVVTAIPTSLIVLHSFYKKDIMASPTDSMTERPMMNDNMGTEQDNNTNGSGAMSDTSVAREEKTPDPKPAASVDGGYGWVCVFATFLINCHTFGINSVISLRRVLCTNQTLTVESEFWSLPCLLHRK